MEEKIRLLIKEWKLVISVCEREIELIERYLEMDKFDPIKESLVVRLKNHELEKSIYQDNIRELRELLKCQTLANVDF